MTAAPPSRSGSGKANYDHPHKITLSREEADFAVKHCGLTVEEYAAEKLRLRHMKSIDPDRYNSKD